MNESMHETTAPDDAAVDTSSRDHATYRPAGAPLPGGQVQAARRLVTSAEQGVMALAAALFGPDMTPPAWHEAAACRGADPRAFDQAAPAARALCARCPVRELCAADALRWERTSGHAGAGRQAGLRGGMSSYDRRCAHQRHRDAHQDDPSAPGGEVCTDVA